MWISSVCWSILPESAGSEVGVAVGVGVPVVVSWLLCSESGEEVRGEEEGTELSSDAELEGGGAVTVEDGPEEEEEADLGMGAATAGLSGTSGVSVPNGLSGALDCWLTAPVGAAGVFDAPSGRTAVPENKKNITTAFDQCWAGISK